MWSCGDDDDSTGATGGKSAGGNAGKGGAAMTGGGTSKGGTTNTSGGATNKGGGTSTTGGKTNGGSTGMAGGGAGGAGEGGGGAGPVAGAGAGGTMGGAGAGGVVGEGGGGVSGGSGGAGAGAGGEGGEAPLTLSQACTIACAHVPTNCPTVDEDNSCAARCTSLYDASQSPSVADDEPQKSADIARLNQEYVGMLRCLATKVTANSGYVCRADGNESPIAAWSAAAATACEAEVCTWTLDDANFADPDVYERCSL